MSNTVEQKLFNEIDKICKSTDLLQTLPLGEKVKLLEFRTHLCDINGATKDALDIVVKAEDNDDKMRTYFIEINGALAKTITQSSAGIYGNSVALSVAGAILAENWNNPFAWFIATTSAISYYLFGEVVSLPLGDKSEKEAKNIAEKIYDDFIKSIKISNENSQNANLPNSDKNDKFTNLQNIASNETASNSQNSHLQQTPQLQNMQTSRHSERSEESHKNSQNVNS